MEIEHLELDKNIKFHLAKLEVIPQANHMTADEIASANSVLHPATVEYLKKFGRSTWADGQLQVCHPNDLRPVLALVFGADEDFNHKSYSTYAYSAFGRLYLWHHEYGLAEIDLIEGEVKADGLKKYKEGADISGRINTFKAPFRHTTGDTNNFYDENGNKLFARCVERLGAVNIGECFGFFPALALGGVPSIEHVKKVAAFEHFTFLAQLEPFKWVHTEVDFTTGRLEKSIIREIG